VDKQGAALRNPIDEWCLVRINNLIEGTILKYHYDHMVRLRQLVCGRFSRCEAIQQRSAQYERDKTVEQWITHCGYERAPHTGDAHSC